MEEQKKETPLPTGEREFLKEQIHKMVELVTNEEFLELIYRFVQKLVC